MATEKTLMYHPSGTDVLALSAMWNWRVVLPPNTGVSERYAAEPDCASERDEHQRGSSGYRRLLPVRGVRGTQPSRRVTDGFAVDVRQCGCRTRRRIF